tara:strand:- start:2369 stop:4576 length:2208 start_codon:yes stop_codon:yes gene_type:complete
MTSRDTPTDHISKAMVIDLLETQKDAQEIVDLWNRYVDRDPKKGEEEKHDRLGNLGGVWSLKDTEVEHLISLLTKQLIKQRRNENIIAKHDDEIGKAKEDVHTAKRRTEDAEKNTALVKRNLIWVLGEVVNSGLPSTIRQQILENVLSKVSGLPGDELKAHIPTHFRETSNVTNVGSIVCAGERVILDKDYAIGVTGAFTEFGELVISWDSSNSADSCRAMGNENSLTIAICDGSSEGDISSRVFSRLLTTVLTEMVPLSEKARAVLTGQPMVDFLSKRISHKNEKDVDVFGRVVRDFTLQDAEEAQEGLSAAGATAVNVIIHRTGWCWSSGVGDSALYLIQNGEDIKPLILSPKLEEAATPLIRLTRPVRVEHGEVIKLQEGDVLIGVTDFVAEYIEADRKRLFEILSKCKDHSSARQPSFWHNLFKNISDSQEGDDDMTIFVYVHGSEALPFDSTTSGYEEANRTYTVGPLQYEEFEKDYYANQTVPKGSRRGAKRINNKIASNLRIILETLQPNWPDFLPSYEVVQTGSNDYFLLMDHYEKEEYIRLDELIESSDSSDLTKVIDLLINIENRIDECRISHGDISPTNIIVHKDTFDFKLLDLNTLYFQGCFPHDESGHKGMYGQDGLPCIPSIYAHKFPLRSLRLSMELMKSMIDHGQAKKGSDCFSPSADEEYVLGSEKLRDYFRDSDGKRLDEHTDELKSKFPDMDENTIRKQLSSLSITEIYNLDNWGY